MAEITAQERSGNSGTRWGSMTASVEVPAAKASLWRQYLAFAGPGIMISVGYMDPGNWATDLQAGAQFKYGLLWVVALSSLMAMVLQIIAARLGVASGKDLAQCCHDWYPKWSRIPNWLICELAIAACDLAECLGSAVALRLLFGIPLLWATLITAFDVLLLLCLQRLGMRTIEAVVALFVITITGCYFIEVLVLPQTQPSARELFHAMFHPTLRQPGMLFLAIGIIGATVMPHNLYLHSALVQSRKFQADDESIRRAIQLNTIDCVTSLFVAFLVNGAILVLAGLVFYGKHSVEVSGGGTVAFTPNSDWIQVAFLTLAPLVGTTTASTLFAVALLASGQSSTITGTLSGQVVMEGFMNWRIRPWVRRLASRLIAIVPAVIIIGLHGDQGVTELLTMSQVVLGLQLPFAMVPMLQFAGSRKRLGRWANGWFLTTAGWCSCTLIIMLDIVGLPDSFREAWRILTQ